MRRVGRVSLFFAAEVGRKKLVLFVAGKYGREAGRGTWATPLIAKPRVAGIFLSFFFLRIWKSSGGWGWGDKNAEWVPEGAVAT